jgi:alpha-L-fucosidase
MKSLLTALSLSALCLSAPAFAQRPDGNLVNETPEQFAKRTKWWREAKFGMFIHWGVYSVPADSKKGLAEWYFSNERLQVAEYEKFVPQFNPTKFDAKKIVAAAKYAGMKYIVITSKHHDGFAMFNSSVSPYDIVDATPYKRDLMKDLANECKKQGVRLCFYHSIMDWHHPDYLPRREWEKETRPAAGANYARYVDYMKTQLRELVNQYNPGVMWFDGEWENTWTHEMGKDLYAYVRGLKPDILINNRVDKGRQGMQGMTAAGTFMGDFGTPEQEIPPTGFADGRLWETCMTMNDTWGYARNDNNWKSSDILIKNLIDVASKGGNYLLNVGPTETGELTPETYDRLAALGRWMSKNSTAIYGTSGSPFARLTFNGRCTRKGNTLYLHVFHWPGTELTLDGLTTKVANVRVLGGEKLSYEQKSGFGTPSVLRIAKPRTLDPVATVIEVKLAAPLQMAQAER